MNNKEGTMRKFLFTLSLLLVCHIGYGQNIDSIFEEFGSEQNAEYVRISPFMKSLGMLFCKNVEGIDILHKVKSLKVLDMDDCSTKVKERFNGRISKLNHRGYEELIRVNDGGEKVRILMKIKKDAIRELLIICSGNDDCTLVQINGKFTKDDIDGLVAMETGTKNGRR